MAKVANWINTFKGSSAQVRVAGKPLHSTFEGGGGGAFTRAWGDVKAQTGPLYVVPSWTYGGGVDAVRANLDVVDGACTSPSP